MMAETFSWGINDCFFIGSDLACSCCWNSTSWAKSWILGFMVGNKPRRIFFGDLIRIIWPSGHSVFEGHLFAQKLKIWLDLVMGLSPSS